MMKMTVSKKPLTGLLWWLEQANRQIEARRPPTRVASDGE
jgi:hypothetical protein